MEENGKYGVDEEQLIKPCATTPTLNAQTEKPTHYSYLKEFRVDACPLFKAHQCGQHRPYTCFHWHFANQRRRRSVRRRDGTFNYSPDIYCTKYDENSGHCPDGDECPFLHRVAGDVERKYHLRYYKTALCVHPTDAKGLCLKNGIHCAFAHSPEDLRAPIFDIREIQQSSDTKGGSEILDQKDRTSFVVEDQIWQDQEHVLACYKTEICKKPPRLCRQGYACPFYHNNKDRRRPPGTFKYRSTPCPAAKAGDEWADPEGCESGDPCQYCHTRTEQQFHPEIYKSTRCNDMLQHGYCPRGPFCAFAHSDDELHAERKVKTPSECYALIGKLHQHQHLVDSAGGLQGHQQVPAKVDIPEAPYPPPSESVAGRSHSFSTMDAARQSVNGPNLAASAPSYSSVLKQRNVSGGGAKQIGVGSRVGGQGQIQPIAAPQQRTFSFDSTGSQSYELSSSYPKAPGFERQQQSPTRVWAPEGSGNGGQMGRARTTSLTVGSSHHGIDPFCGTPDTPGSLRSSSFSPFGGGPWGSGPQGSFGMGLKDPQGDSGIGMLNPLEDLSLDDQHLTTISEREESGQDGLRVLAKSADSSNSSDIGLYGSSAPVSIPGAVSQGLFSSSGPDNQFRMSGSFGQPMFPSDFGGGGSTGVLVTELQKTKEELASHRAKLVSWEEGLKQARHACEAWKREAEEHKKRAMLAEIEKQQIAQERDTALRQLQAIKQEMGRITQRGNIASGPNALAEIPVGLDNTYNRLRKDFDRIENQFQTHLVGGPACGRCGRHVNSGIPNSGCPVCAPNSKNPASLAT